MFFLNREKDEKKAKQPQLEDHNNLFPFQVRV